MKILLLLLSTILFANFSYAEVQCKDDSIDGLKSFLTHIRKIDQIGEITFIKQTNDDLVFTSTLVHEQFGVSETFQVAADLDNQCIIDGIISTGYGISYENKVMEELAGRYKNIFTQDDIDKDDQDQIKALSSNELPSTVIDFLKSLEISLFQDGKTLVNGTSQYFVFNNEFDDDNSDVFVVTDKDKKDVVVGYIFNVTQCDTEECYGWDALYVGPKGQLVYKSF